MAKYKHIVLRKDGKKITKSGPNPPYKMKFNLISASYVTRIPKPVISMHEEKQWMVTIDKKEKKLIWSPLRKEKEDEQS